MNTITSSRSRGWKLVLIFAVVICLAGVGMGSVQAQPNMNGGQKPAFKGTPTAPNPVVDGGELAADEAQTGDITEEQYIFSYTYSGSKGDEVTLTMEATDGLEPLVAIFAPKKADKPLKAASAAKNKTATLTVTLPADGTYDILASRAGATTGKSTGSFTLTLSLGSGGDSSGGGGSDTGGGRSDPTDLDLTQYPAEFDVSSNQASDIISQMRDAQLIPKGGRQVITVPRSVIEVTQTGLSYVPLASGTKVKNFVFSFRLRFDEYGNMDNNQCGMAFRAGSTGLSLVGLSNTKNFELEQIENKKDIFNVDKPIEADSFSVATDAINTFTVVALDDVLLVYLDGSLIAGKQAKAVSGIFATYVFNQDGNSEATGCAYSNIWVWGFN